MTACPRNRRRGYLGSILVPALLDRGFAVTVVDNFMYGQDSLAAVCYQPEFSLVRGDVRSIEHDAAAAEDADIIIPLAALVGAPLCDRDPLAATSTNLQAIVDMLGDAQPRAARAAARSPTAATASARPASSAPRRRRSGRCRSTAATRSRSSGSLLDRHPSAISFRLATVFGMSPRMRLDLLVNDFTYRAVHRPLHRAVREPLQAQLHPRARRGARVPARHRSLRRDEGQIVQRRAVGREPVEAGAVPADPAAAADVRRSRVADRQGSRPARLHRLEREDRAHRLPARHSRWTTASAS